MISSLGRQDRAIVDQDDHGLRVHDTCPRVPIADGGFGHEMIEIHGHMLDGICIRNSDCGTSEVRVAHCVTQDNGITNVICPIAPVRVLVNQRLKQDARSFEWVRRDVCVVEFQVFEECRIVDIGQSVAGSFLVTLSIDHEIRAFVTVGTQQNGTFLNCETTLESDEQEEEKQLNLKVSCFQHGDRILR